MRREAPEYVLQSEKRYAQAAFLCLLQWPCRSSSWLVNALINSGALSRSGIAPNWPANSKLRGSSTAFRLPPSDASCTPTSSNPGAPISGGRRKCPVTASRLEQIRILVDLCLCPLGREEMVFCIAEKTNPQSRSRLASTLPARPGQPLRVEHEYKRAGRCICLPPLIPAPGRSMREPRVANDRGIHCFPLPVSAGAPRRQDTPVLEVG